MVPLMVAILRFPSEKRSRRIACELASNREKLCAQRGERPTAFGKRASKRRASVRIGNVLERTANASPKRFAQPLHAPRLFSVVRTTDASLKRFAQRLFLRCPFCGRDDSFEPVSWRSLSAMFDAPIDLVNALGPTPKAPLLDHGRFVFP